ncbi:MAG TPA: PQQ-dependent sugar dehydrogenase [Thermoanaerobaculia bacterium]|nr:PQQ-dependent sugar dehydrogenase [Thermoanaerobaculia bacterium]
MDSRHRRAARIALLALLALSCGRGLGIAAIGGGAGVDRIKLPAGFRIAVYADGVSGARSLVLAPTGTVFVGTRDGEVYAIPDQDHDGKPEAVQTIARGLDEPNGVAWKDGDLYVAEVTRVLRYDDVESYFGKKQPAPKVFFSGLPKQSGHQWRYARFGPDGWLWIGIGAPCNVCTNADPFGTVSRIAPDGSRLEVWARGVRNSVGFDWQPQGGALWFTDNGRDWLGDDRPPDELNRAPRAGMHFGFPYCQGGDIPDPDEGQGHRCSDYTAPAAKLGPHVAALGMRFYRGTMFPAEYRGAIFIAEHGSWNRTHKIGYRISVVDVDGERTSRYRVFAEGWLQDGGEWGRPVDVLEMPDGALLVSDDARGAVYRISYGGR